MSLRPILFCASALLCAPPSAPAALLPSASAASPSASLQAPSAGADLTTAELSAGFTGRVPEADEWVRWLARDRRVAFARGSAEAALEALDGGAGDATARAVAWTAVGAGGGAQHVTLLEQAAGEGSTLERCAATLALGSAGQAARRGLRRLYDASEGELRECALLSLLLADPEARELARSVAQRDGDPLRAAAGELLLFAREPSTARPTHASALLLELRWLAALRYGTVDGAALPVLRARALLSDQDFVREVVLGIADIVRRPGVADHVLTELLEGEGLVRLRAAVACIPEQLGEVVRYGFFAPADADEWRAILDEIDLRGNAYRAVELLRAASAVPEVRWRALRALVEIGDPEAREALGAGIEDLSVADLCLLCDALGTTGDRDWTTRLEELTRRDEPELSASALVARMRLGSDAARDGLLFALEEGDAAERAAVLDAMLRNVRDPRVVSWLVRVLRDAGDDEAFRVATGLAEAGNGYGRTRLKELFAAAPPRGAAGARAVRALGEARDADEVRALRALYPVEGERAVNVALARTLIRAHDLDALPIVRSALWNGGFDVSVLAGGLEVELFGVRVLVDELARPPAEATSADIRRVGFAVGEWGGLEEVDHLAKQLRFNSGHPALQGALLGALTQRTR